MIHAAAIADEAIDFRCRIRENKIVLHDKLHPSFAYLNESEDDL
jgi:chloramphenicol O-acetyltransferase type A